MAPFGPRGDNQVSGEHRQNFSSSLEHPCGWKGAKEGALRFLPQTSDTAETSSAYACQLHKTSSFIMQPSYNTTYLIAARAYNQKCCQVAKPVTSEHRKHPLHLPGTFNVGPRPISLCQSLITGCHIVFHRPPLPGRAEGPEGDLLERRLRAPHEPLPSRPIGPLPP